MRAARKTAEEQYQLVLECRRTGMADCGWCRENGINLETFYTWIRRLRGIPKERVRSYGFAFHGKSVLIG